MVTYIVINKLPLYIRIQEWEVFQELFYIDIAMGIFLMDYLIKIFVLLMNQNGGDNETIWLFRIINYAMLAL